MPQDEARLFKERDAVIAPIENAHFPCRCVKTNAPVESADYKIVIDLSPSQIRDGKPKGKVDDMIAGAIGGKTGRAVWAVGKEIAKKKRITLHVGLSEQLRKRRSKLLYTAIALLVSGPVGFIVAATVIVNLATSAGEKPSGVAVLVAAGLGTLVFIAGIVAFGIWNLGILRILSSDGERIWLSGAGKDFLEQLLELPQETTA